jgi:hypothetical protein
MATVTNNQDGTLTVTLSDAEVTTVSMIQDDSIAQYVTLWLGEKAKQLFASRFAQLSPTDQADVLAKFAAP